MIRRLPVYYGWIIVATIATILTAAAGARLLYGVVLKPMSEQFGWDRASLTAAVMINMVAMCVLQPVVGLLADKIGPKRILVGGTLLIAAMLVPLSFATRLWQIYALYGLIGSVAFAATSPVNITTLVNRWFVRRRGTALSLATSGTAFGQLLVVPVATWVLTVTDWQTSYRLLAILLAVVMAPLGWLALKDNPAQVGAVLDDELLAPDVNRTGAATLTARQRFADEEREGATLRQALASSAFWILAFGFIACGFTMAFANTHFMAFADDMGMGAMMAANVVAVTAVFSIAGAVALGLLADRWRRSYVLAITYALRGASFLLLLLLPIGQLDFFYAIVLGFSWTATTPLAASIAGDLYGRANFGVIFGTMFTFMNIGFGLGAFLDGLMYDSMGHYRVALIANCGLGFAAAVATLLVKDPASRAVARPPVLPRVAVALEQRRTMSGD